MGLFNKKILKSLASMKWTVSCLALLFILTLWGTVAQVTDGLYLAQERFFNSYFFLVGGILPFPGARLVLWVLFINLVAASCTRLVFQWRQAGIIITHVGLLVFFVAAFVTFHFTRESYVALFEGEGTNVSTAYHDWELAAWTEHQGKRDVEAVDLKGLGPGDRLVFSDYGLALRVEQYFLNSHAYTRVKQSGGDKIYNDTGIGAIEADSLRKDPSKNIPGAVFRIEEGDQKGALLMLYGGETRPTRLTNQGKTVMVSLRRSRYSLPFFIQLKDFKKELHPNTAIARSYESRVVITQGDGGGTREVLISMNKPLRYGAYTLYQASYAVDETGREMSTLAVVKNRGRLLPYIASAIVSLGLLVHVLMMAFPARGRSSRVRGSAGSPMGRGKKAVMLGLLFLGFLGGWVATPVAAQPMCPLERTFKPKTVTSLAGFERLPILHQGRIKPMDTYARYLLLQLSGRTSYHKRSAIEWLAALVFAPETTWDDKVFLINHPDIPTALGLQVEKGRRYSYNQLGAHWDKLAELARAASQVKERDRNIVEKEVLRVYTNMLLFLRHSHVTSFAFPHEDFQVRNRRLRQRLELPNQSGYSFLDIALKVKVLQDLLQPAENKPMEQLSTDEKTLFALLHNMYRWSMAYEDPPFFVVPSVEEEDDSWLSPWDAIRREFYSGKVRKELDLWRDLTVAYWNGDQSAFDVTARRLAAAVSGRVSKKERQMIRTIPLELRYNHGRFYMWAKLFYGLAFLFLLGFLGTRKRWVYGGAWVLVLGGLAAQGYAQGLRIAILGRPPVTNLFETFIFVALLCAVIGLIMEARNRQGLGLLIATLGGFVFLMISGRFSADGDTMQMLVAVLNSNFWLATHVITITVGYAGCLAAGIIGHWYLLQAASGRFSLADLRGTHGYLVGALSFGLMMSFIGTIMGGIWADQSWGRFWGWDPKENGALLIVLWVAIILHAKAGRLIGPLGVAVMSVIGNGVVMWAWLGVNLLNVGLHSYGFTSGIAKGLMGYVLFEGVFLAFFLPRARKGEMRLRNKIPQ